MFPACGWRWERHDSAMSKSLLMARDRGSPQAHGAIPAVFDSIFRWFSKGLAIDLRTANTLIYVKGEGIVCN
jgi:hypothetical protein